MAEELKFCRINLISNTYFPYMHYKVLGSQERKTYSTDLKNIYRDYCIYKNFLHPMPIFESQFVDHNNDVIVYYDNAKIVAFSLVRRYDNENVESLQFAWDYKNPKLRLGISSMETECFYYKEKGFKFLYLGLFNNYKKDIAGFELTNIKHI